MTTATASLAPTPETWRSALSRAEMDALLRVSDLRGWLSIVVDWALVFASFALVHAWPNPLTVVVALFVIGARQLGLAILMHEASHYTLLRDRTWNDRVGNWLCAYPVWGDLFPYRAYHMQHHVKTGTDQDPDLGLAAPFPITKESFRRKVWRDLSGQTGVKRARATLRRDLGRSQGKVGRKSGAGVVNLRGVAITNLVLFALVALLFHPALYLLWVGAWLTTYSLVMRVRSIAEHGMVPDRLDPVRNTRTTLAGPLERLFLAPNRVNYHLEHHLLMKVPHHQLPRLHALLQARGAIAPECVTRGYREVLRLATTRPAGHTPAFQPGPTQTALTQRPPF
jgi:fatty acid desaturase